MPSKEIWKSDYPSASSRSSQSSHQAERHFLQTPREWYSDYPWEDDYPSASSETCQSSVQARSRQSSNHAERNPLTAPLPWKSDYPSQRSQSNNSSHQAKRDFLLTPRPWKSDYPSEVSQISQFSHHSKRETAPAPRPWYSDYPWISDYPDESSASHLSSNQAEPDFLPKPHRQNLKPTLVRPLKSCLQKTLRPSGYVRKVLFPDDPDRPVQFKLGVAERDKHYKAFVDKRKAFDKGEGQAFASLSGNAGSDEPARRLVGLQLVQQRLLIGNQRRGELSSLAAEDGSHAGFDGHHQSRRLSKTDRTHVSQKPEGIKSVQRRPPLSIASFIDATFETDKDHPLRKPAAIKPVQKRPQVSLASIVDDGIPLSHPPAPIVVDSAPKEEVRRRDNDAKSKATKESPMMPPVVMVAAPAAPARQRGTGPQESDDQAKVIADDIRNTFRSIEKLAIRAPGDPAKPGSVKFPALESIDELAGLVPVVPVNSESAKVPAPVIVSAPVQIPDLVKIHAPVKVPAPVKVTSSAKVSAPASISAPTKDVDTQTPRKVEKASQEAGPKSTLPPVSKDKPKKSQPPPYTATAKGTDVTLEPRTTQSPVPGLASSPAAASTATKTSAAVIAAKDPPSTRSSTSKSRPPKDISLNEALAEHVFFPQEPSSRSSSNGGSHQKIWRAPMHVDNTMKPVSSATRSTSTLTKSTSSGGTALAVPVKEEQESKRSPGHINNDSTRSTSTRTRSTSTRTRSTSTRTRSTSTASEESRRIRGIVRRRPGSPMESSPISIDRYVTYTGPGSSSSSSTSTIRPHQYDIYSHHASRFVSPATSSVRTTLASDYQPFYSYTPAVLPSPLQMSAEVPLAHPQPHMPYSVPSAPPSARSGDSIFSLPSSLAPTIEGPTASGRIRPQDYEDRSTQRLRAAVTSTGSGTSRASNGHTRRSSYRPPTVVTVTDSETYVVRTPDGRATVTTLDQPPMVLTSSASDISIVTANHGSASGKSAYAESDAESRGHRRRRSRDDSETSARRSTYRLPTMETVSESDESIARWRNSKSSAWSMLAPWWK